MSCENCNFKGVNTLKNSMLMNSLEINLKTWLDWGFIKIGGFTNVNIPTSGIEGGNWHTLVLEDNPEYDEGQVWRAAYKDWVWEGEMVFHDLDSSILYTPNEVEVYVDDVLVDTDDYYINYPLGQVIFNDPTDEESVVTAQYSFRQVQVYIADQTPWWNELQYRSFRVEDSFFTQSSSGAWSIGPQHRIQMPCIILETVPRTRSKGYQLGDGARIVEQDVLCHVIGESRQSRNRIMDILLAQFDKNLQLFDVDAVALAEDFPLDYRGMIVDNTKTFPVLSDMYPLEKCRFSRTDCTESISINPRLFNGLVRLTCEVILDD